jgi:hypothetical protein
MSIIKMAGRSGFQLSRRTGDEVVDTVMLVVLEVVRVSAKHHSDARLSKETKKLLHRTGVAMRAGAEQRMVTERDPPHRGICVGW